MQIIVAEDNPDHCELLEYELREYFPLCEILVASTGEELLQFLRASHEMPDLILMDIKMPRMNGLESIRAVRRVDTWRKIPIIVNSTSASELEIDACLSLGASFYLTKPLDGARLRECLAQLNLAH